MLALAVMFNGATLAMAESEITANVALSSEYVWRGISQSDEDAAISGGLDFTSDLFYAGVWASNVDFNDNSDTNIEIDLYAGLASQFDNGVSWDAGVISYNYPDSSSDSLNFYELYGGLGYAFEGGLEIGGKASWDPDNQNVYLETSAAYPLGENVAVNAGLGNYSFDGAGDYTTWSIGGTYSAFGVDFALQYHDTDMDGNRLADQRVVFSISRSM